MSDFRIDFDTPWLLLLLIPAAAFALWPYFRLSRKYRRTRNRIGSIILHMVVMVLTVSVLAGCHFDFKTPNRDNEIILLVDMSYSNRDSVEKKNEFIRSVLDESNGKFRVGIVTFGRDFIDAAEFNTDTFDVYQDYLASKRPDDSASDIAGALNHASKKFSNPQAGKIVLISDGIETDGEASTAIMQIAAEGIRVDTVHFPDTYEDEVMVLGVEHSGNAILVGVPVEFTVTLESSYSGDATITVVDNGVESAPMDVAFKPNADNVFPIMHTFTSDDLHRLRFKIEADGDTLNENNTFYTYVYINVHSNILIVDGGDFGAGSDDADSKALREILNEGGYGEGSPAVIDLGAVSTDINDLIQYDEIILVNVAVADMPEGLESALQEYVEVYGGGLFTVGGDKAYDREDLSGSVLQRLLPIEVVEYTPPLAVVVVMDRSQSMRQPSGLSEGGQSLTKLDLAKKGAIAAIGALENWDYCGVVTLEAEYNLAIPITPGTQKQKVQNQVGNIQPGGSTVYYDAIQYAATLLKSVSDEVEFKHIIFVSDGGLSDSKTGVENLVKFNRDNSGITFSTVFVGSSTGETSGGMFLSQLATLYGGGTYFDGAASPGEVAIKMKQQITDKQNARTNEDDYTPSISAKYANYHTSAGVYGETMPIMNGFYGGRVKRQNKNPVEVPLNSVLSMPLYAEWSVGNGRVGSFMADLNGKQEPDGWSSEFVKSEVGKRFIHNVVRGLLPANDIRPKPIEMNIVNKNYTSELIIKASLKTGQYLQVDAKNLDSSDANATYSNRPEIPNLTDETTLIHIKTGFPFQKPGVYEVVITTRRSGGEVMDTLKAYTAFSFSSEYNVFVDINEAKAFLESLATRANGEYYGLSPDITLEEALEYAPRSLMQAFTVTSPKTVDPKIAFIIIAVMLFLLDVAVRKFKFKWPWEIVRDNKIKKDLARHGKDSKYRAVGK